MRLKFFAMLVASLGAGGLHAQSLDVPKRDPFEQTKLVAYNYGENETFPVVARSGMFTVIEAPAEEAVQGFYLSDTDQWSFHIAGNKRHIFVKPASGGLFNSGTLITDKRTYLLAMTSNDSGVWYQKIHWVIPEARDGRDKFENYEESPAANMVKDGGTPNFEYDIEGKADFRPLSVYDNGKFTRFVLPKNVQELPALFSLDAQGEPEVVNYTVQGNALQTNRLMHGALLKLGTEEVRIYNRAMRPKKRSWFNSSGWGS